MMEHLAVDYVAFTPMKGDAVDDAHGLMCPLIPGGKPVLWPVPLSRSDYLIRHMKCRGSQSGTLRRL